MAPRARTCVPIVIAAMAVACAHTRGAKDDATTVSQTTTTGSGMWMADPGTETRGTGQPIEPSPPALSDPAHPANRIANEACERELDCSEIGEGRTFATEQSCLIAARRHAAEHFARTSCEQGIDDARLSDCMTAVRFAPCTPGPEALDRIPACAAARLCAR